MDTLKAEIARKRKQLEENQLVDVSLLVKLFCLLASGATELLNTLT